MTDIIDEANDYAEKETEASLSTIRAAASDINKIRYIYYETCGK